MENLDSILEASGNRRLFLKGLGALGGSVLIGCGDNQERNPFGYQDVDGKISKGTENGIRYVSFADGRREHRLYEDASEFEVHDFKSGLAPYTSRAAKPAIIQPGSSYGMRSIDERAAKPADSSDISWMPYLQGDWSRNRKIDFDDFFLFVDYFGSSNPEYDLDGNGKVDFNDFFLFVDKFGKEQSGFDVALAPLLTGQLEVSHPSSPGLRYLLPNNTGMGRVVVSDGNPIVTNLDVPAELYGKSVEVEALGFDDANDPVRGGRGVVRMPNYYYNGVPNGGRVDFTLPSSQEELPQNLLVYIVTKNLDDYYKLELNSLVGAGGRGINFATIYTNGNSKVDMIDFTDYMLAGANYIRFKEQLPSQIIVSDSATLKPNL